MTLHGQKAQHSAWLDVVILQTEFGQNFVACDIYSVCMSALTCGLVAC